MGKAAQTKKSKKLEARNNARREGLIEVLFYFDGEAYYKKHQMTAIECDQMKVLCRDGGDAAAGSALWSSAVWGAGNMARQVIQLAGKDCVCKYFTGKPPPPPMTQEEIDAAIAEVVAEKVEAEDRKMQGKAG